MNVKGGKCPVHLPFLLIIRALFRLMNSSPPQQNDCYFADNTYSYIFISNFMNWMLCFFIQISLKFVPKEPIYNKRVLIQVMAWGQTGDKPLSESTLTQFADAYLRYCVLPLHYKAAQWQCIFVSFAETLYVLYVFMCLICMGICIGIEYMHIL